MTGTSRIDTARRVIRASPEVIYKALTDPRAVAAWRPPNGMRAEISTFDAREGGAYRMALSYDDETTPGKTCANTDVIEGRFIELVSNARVVELVTFQSDNPAFAGAMTVRTELAPVEDGTEVTVSCENVPPGISAADHAAGLSSTLANLAAFTE